AVPARRPGAAPADLEGLRRPSAGDGVRPQRVRAADRPPRPPAHRLPGAAADPGGPGARHPAAAGRGLSRRRAASALRYLTRTARRKLRVRPSVAVSRTAMV